MSDVLKKNAFTPLNGTSEDYERHICSVFSTNEEERKFVLKAVKQFSSKEMERILQCIMVIDPVFLYMPEELQPYKCQLTMRCFTLTAMMSDPYSLRSFVNHLMRLDQPP